MSEILSYSTVMSSIRNNNIGCLYLFYGSEQLLIKDILARLEKKVINPSLRSLNYIKIDGENTNSDDIINACETLPFMDEKKIVLVKNCVFLESKKSGANDELLEGLSNYLPGMSDTTVLIFICGSEVDKRRKLFNVIKKYGTVAEFSQLKNQDLVKWIIKQFEKNHKIISRLDAAYMGDLTSGMLDDVQNEIIKVCSYIDDRNEVTRDDINAVVTRSLEMNIFQLVDAVSLRSYGRALSVLNELLLESQPIPLILTMIARQYRLLLSTKLLAGKGYSIGEMAEKLKLRPGIAGNLLKQSDNYTLSQIEEKLRICLSADKQIKTGQMDQRIIVESLIAQFTM